MTHQRNFDRIEHEYLRRKIDERFNRVHDKLEDAYYNFWKKGQSKRFVARRDPNTRHALLVFDIRPNNPEFMAKATWDGSNWNPTPINATPKEVFDKLHGMIWNKYAVKFHQANMVEALENRVPENEYNDVNEQGEVVAYRHEQAQAAIQNLEAQGFELDGEENADDPEV
jgi:hypothetical protein